MAYVVLVNDRHADPDVQIFENYDTAHTYAQKRAKLYSLDRSYVTEIYDEFTVYRYSPEGDCTSVFERNVLRNLSEAP